MRHADWSLLLALGLLWGFNFILFRVAVADLPPITLVAGRVVLAAAVLSAWVPLRRAGTLPWRAFAVMGLLNGAVPNTLIAFGVAHIDGGLAAVLNGTMPLFTVLLAAGVLRTERLTPARGGGVALGLLGVVVLVGPSVLAGLGREVQAQVAVVGAGLSYAAAALYGRRLLGLPPATAAWGQLTAAAVWMLPLSLLLDAPWALRPGAAAMLAVGASALACTALAYLIYFRLLRRIGPTGLSLVTYLIPLAAVGWGVLLLGEQPTLRAGVAMALILGGVALVNRRQKEPAPRGANPGPLAPAAPAEP